MIRLLGALALVLFVWACTAASSPAAPDPQPRLVASRPVPTDSVEAERNRHMAAVLAEIEGREGERAGDVFENVEVLADVPTDRFVRIMNMGFGRSLGVSCGHCHVVGEWAAEDSTAKQVARQMVVMTQTISGELLPAIEGIQSERPTVNCTTCHRGAVRPALNLPEGPSD